MICRLFREQEYFEHNPDKQNFIVEGQLIGRITVEGAIRVQEYC